MKHLNYILLLALITACAPRQGGEVGIPDKPNDKSNISINEPRRIFDPIQPSRVITYREIEQYFRSLKQHYNFLKEIVGEFQKERMMNELFSRLSENFPYMLSSELRLLRNEFFARRGYIFRSPELNEYFLRQRWYNPLYTSADSIIFSREQQQIIDSILFYEQKNAKLTDDILRNDMLQLLRNAEWGRQWGYYVAEIPIGLFRRNIGYLLVDKNNIEEFELRMFMFGYARALLFIDTIGTNEDILVMALVRQVLCPNDFCIYGGVLFTCDMNFNVIDYTQINFEGLRKERQKNSLIFSFGMPVGFGFEKPTSILIDSNGKITDYTENTSS